MSDAYIGRQVAGQFHIVERIGSGGMGSVYKAEQPDMNRFVAVKILHPRYLSRQDLVARFRREARAMSQLSHPNTARVFLYGQLEDGACYFVMEYLAGRNLAQVVRAEGPMPLERAVRIFSQVCGALEEAHTAGIIHRDLKPENIFLTSQGGIHDFPKVLDFGLAKVTEKQMRPGSLVLTREGMVFGTPEFMSPEQAKGQQLDPRSDIYSLGVIFYELLTGKLPFDAKHSIEYINFHVNGSPIPLNQRIPGKTFPPAIEAAVMRALAKDPAMRYPTATAFAQALEYALRPDANPAALAAVPASTPPPAMAPASYPPPAVVHGSSPTTPGAMPGAVGPAVHRDEPVVVPGLGGSRLPWLVLGAGAFLAVAGLVALAVAFLRG